MAAGPQTYGNVRDTIADSLGVGCKMTDNEMRTFMGNTLLDMWSDLADHRWWTKRWAVALTPAAPNFELPADLWKFSAVSDPATCISIEQVGPTCGPGVINPAEGPSRWAVATPTTPPLPPMTYYLDQRTVRFVNVPVAGVTVEVHGVRFPDLELWVDTVQQDNSLLRTFKTIDLPLQFHSIYTKAVLGFAYALADDLGGAEYWRALAAQEMASLSLKANEPVMQGNTGPLIFGGGLRYEGAGCGRPRYEYEALHGSRW